MPVTTFWMLNRNVDRLTAERGLRDVALMAASQSSEGVKEVIEGLKKQMGSPIKFEEHAPPRETPKLDREGLNSLKDLGSLVK